MAWLRSTASWLDARRRSIALLLLGWVAVLVVAAGRETDDDQWVSIPDGSAVLAVLLLVAVVVGFVNLLILRPRLVGEGSGERRRGSLLAVLIAFVLLVFVALVVFGSRPPGEDLPEPPSAEAPVGGGITGEQSDVSATVDDGSVLLIALLALTAAVVVAWSRRDLLKAGHKADQANTDALESELPGAFERASRVLIDDPDPRVGVLRAYAALEETCAGAGVRRRAWETPTEHLTRALGRFPLAAEPAELLGRLYELARFSDARISDDDRRVAAAALDRAQRGLDARLEANR